MSALSQAQWSRLSTREKVLTVLTVGAIFYAIIAFFVLPRVAQQRQLHIQKSSLEQEVTALSAALPTPTQKTDTTEGALSQSISLPPLMSDPALSVILKEINQAARMSAVQLLELKPGATEKRDKYDLLPIQLKIRSRFRNLDEYILALERLPRPIGIDRLKIESTSQTSPDVTAELTLLVYKKGGA